MDSVRLTDEQSAAVAKSPNTRVKLEDIEENIIAETFVTGDNIAPAQMSVSLRASREVVTEYLRPLTVCILVLRNGFTVIGKAAPADPTNFNPDLGRKFAREDAIRQIWLLMGYALREKLAGR